MATDRSEPAQTSTHNWLHGGGEMGSLIRSLPWGRTAIGAVDSWSPGLRMMVGLLLANRFPLLLWWGPQSGARVTTAQSAADALKALDGDVPDVIVADLGMPHVDGFQFIERCDAIKVRTCGKFRPRR